MKYWYCGSSALFVTLNSNPTLAICFHESVESSNPCLQNNVPERTCKKGLWQLWKTAQPSLILNGGVWVRSCSVYPDALWKEKKKQSALFSSAQWKYSGDSCWRQIDRSLCWGWGQRRFVGGMGGRYAKEKRDKWGARWRFAWVCVFRPQIKEKEKKGRRRPTFYRKKHTLKHFHETQLLAMILTFLGHFCCFVT